MMSQHEDTHFYIDNAPPAEVVHVLRVLSSAKAISPKDISQLLQDYYGFAMQEDSGYSPRRLYDLKLSKRERRGGTYTYRLTNDGYKLQMLLATDQTLAYELLHFLHFTSFTGAVEDRKLFWSYRKCCEYTWNARQAISSKKLAAQIQTDISREFPSVPMTGKVGGRFNATGANQGLAWVRALDPSPFVEDGTLKPRITENFHLPVLALDDFYRNEKLAYGSYIVLTDDVLDKISKVFFLDLTCCRDLLKTATYFTSAITLADTLVGTSVTLNRPYTLFEL